MEGFVYKSYLPFVFSFLMGITTSFWIAGSSFRLSATFDEPVYLKCGLDCWNNHTHKPLMRLGTMPLPVDLETLPLYLWCHFSGKQLDWENDFGWMLGVARTTALVFWWNLLFQCFRLGCIVRGPWCGFFALAAVAVEPNLMGHAALATTDIAVTGCMIATLVGYLKYQNTPGSWNWWETVCWWSFSLFAKASALAFVPILIFSAEVPRLAIFWREASDKGVFWSQFRSIFAGWIRMGLTALFLTFLLCGSDFKQETTFVSWAKSLNEGALREIMVWISENLRIFTNAGEGFAQQIKHNLRGHPSYLLGIDRETAVWYHFPVLLLIKLPTWFFFLLPFVIWRQKANPWLPGLIACAILLAFSINCRVQIGLRLIFPLVVMLMVMLGITLHDWWKSSGSRWIAPSLATLILLGGGGFTMARQFPDGIRYINDFWAREGGPQNLVSDSNYDWGQGLLDLVEVSNAWNHPRKPIWVAYWGADPRVNHDPLKRLVPSDQKIVDEESLRVWLKGKTVAVSATVLYGPPLPVEYRVLREYFQKQPPGEITRSFVVFDFSGK